MAEVLAQFSEPVRAADGSDYRAQACGAPNTDGLWEGWIEFFPLDGGKPIRSQRETTQPNRVDTEYWATGLSAVYLEGALSRALNPVVRKTPVPARAAFQAPTRAVEVAAESAGVNRDAILDPFAVYEHGESMLRQKLGAMAAWHLVNVVIAYRLSDEPIEVLNRMSAPALIETIVARVRQHASVR
jgi:hypothetical protein